MGPESQTVPVCLAKRVHGPRVKGNDNETKTIELFCPVNGDGSCIHIGGCSVPNNNTHNKRIAGADRPAKETNRKTSSGKGLGRRATRVGVHDNQQYPG